MREQIARLNGSLKEVEQKIAFVKIGRDKRKLQIGEGEEGGGGDDDDDVTIDLEAQDIKLEKENAKRASELVR